MNRKITGISLILSLLVFTACDRRDNEISDEVLGALQCEIATTCAGQQTQFGMTGDSWTDFAFGAPVQRDLLDTLREEYGYRITASVLAGLTVRREVEEKRGFISVINNAGPELRYMLVSLGGNDLLSTTEDYYNNGTDITFNARINSLRLRLDRMIIEGNYLKQQQYGGSPLVWIFHGYDYPNPEIENSCVKGAINAGMPESDAKQLAGTILNKYNDFLISYTHGNPDARYIDLRGTLGGPPYSQTNLMFDCIHPNTLGHSVIAARYHEVLKGYTNNAR